MMMEQWDAWESQRKRQMAKSRAEKKVVNNAMSKYSYAYNVPAEVKQRIIADKLREKRLAYLQSLAQWREEMEIHHQKWEMQKSILKARAVIAGTTESTSTSLMQLLKNEKAPNKGKPPQYETGFTPAEIRSIAISFQETQKLKEDEAQENEEIAARLFQEPVMPKGRRRSMIDIRGSSTAARRASIDLRSVTAMSNASNRAATPSRSSNREAATPARSNEGAATPGGSYRAAAAHSSCSAVIPGRFNGVASPGRSNGATTPGRVS